LQLKFLTEISNNSHAQIRSYALYAWGANHSGQLGTKISNNILHPTKIQLPNFENNDEIEKIVVGQNISTILTKNKKIFVTGLIAKNKKGKEEEEKGEGKDKKKAKKDEGKKEKSFWIEVGDSFKVLRFNLSFVP
jgi:alpha-tubulin suppressor-like RCC1 family protein